MSFYSLWDLYLSSPKASSRVLIILLIETGLDSNLKSLIGNPVLHNWFEIPKPPEPCKFTGLVTCLDEHGLVSSFKVVRTCESSDKYEWKICVYSSELASWTTMQLSSSHSIRNASDRDAMSFNGMIYLLVASEPTETDVLIAYDFYASGDECRVRPLPRADYGHIRTSKLTFGGHAHLMRCLTSAEGQVFFLELVGRRMIKFRLTEGFRWQLLSCGHTMSVEYMNQCFPLAMNPFDSDIIYFWSLQHGCFVSGNNEWGEEYIVHEESENWNWRSDNEGCCRVNTCESNGYMQSLFDAGKEVIVLSQFVLPQCLDSVPTKTDHGS